MSKNWPAHGGPKEGTFMAINYWPAGERPREKLIGAGVSSLSDAELQAIFLRSGVRGQDAVNLARAVLKPLMA